MFIGRKPEIEILRRFHESNEAEFLVVCGRRRVVDTPHRSDSESLRDKVREI